MKTYPIPYMNLHHDDVLQVTDKAEELSDIQMERIASQLGELLANDWDTLLSCIKESRPELFEVE